MGVPPPPPPRDVRRNYNPVKPGIKTMSPRAHYSTFGLNSLGIRYFLKTAPFETKLPLSFRGWWLPNFLCNRTIRPICWQTRSGRWTREPDEQRNTENELMINQYQSYMLTRKTNSADKMNTADVLTNKMNTPANVKTRFNRFRRPKTVRVIKTFYHRHC